MQILEILYIYEGPYLEWVSDTEDIIIYSVDFVVCMPFTYIASYTKQYASYRHRNLIYYIYMYGPVTPLKLPTDEYI